MYIYMEKVHTIKSKCGKMLKIGESKRKYTRVQCTIYYSSISLKFFKLHFILIIKTKVVRNSALYKLFIKQFVLSCYTIFTILA